MDGTPAVGAGMAGPPARLFERLRQISGYTWDETKTPFHSTYDNWHVYGTKLARSSLATAQSATHLTRLGPERSSSMGPPAQKFQSSTRNAAPPASDAPDSASVSDEDGAERQDSAIEVVARISTHALREERAYHICSSLVRSNDPEGEHIVRYIDFLRLSSQPGDKWPLVVSIYEYPGPNHLTKLVDFGPAWYKRKFVVGAGAGGAGPQASLPSPAFAPEEVPLPTFLDFAIGAVECLGILHHGQRIVHGEIRGDAFHFNELTGRVKILNFGSGLRSFEHGLTSSGWSSLSREAGAKTKLAFISPEQTGRMPAEPDSRTDIYSLGILFWTLLTRQTAFTGSSPMDVIQGVLGRRIPFVSSVRLDVPDVVGRIVQKMTVRGIGDRYQSVRGLLYDLLEVQRLLGNGDRDGLETFKIASKDISSFFILPTSMFGRTKEHDEIVKVIDRVSRSHALAQRSGALSSISSSSGASEARGDVVDGTSSEGTSSLDGKNGQILHASTVSRERRLSKAAPTTTSASNSNSNQASYDGQESVSLPYINPWEGNTSLSQESRGSGFSSSIDGEARNNNSEGVGSLTKQRNIQKFRPKGRCEIVSIRGSTGLGKSCLLQSIQVEARRRGYFASSKFDQAKQTPFGPVLRLLSSLFRQLFSEAKTNTQFHEILKQYVRPAWPMLHKMLGLPEFLLDSGPPKSTSKLSTGHASPMFNKNLQMKIKRRGSSPSSVRSSLLASSVGAQNAQDYLRSGSSTKSMRLLNTFLDVLRLFAHYKFICLCLDDLQFADDESLELIQQVIASKMKLVIIVTYRPEEMLPHKLREIIEPPDREGVVYTRNENLRVTNINLSPLVEPDIISFVAATLCRPKEEVVSLALVVQAKTAGNPFYMREMLDACHRKLSIYYDYSENKWQFDLNRIFLQFESDNYQDLLDNDFVSRRLGELPLTTRAILAWASLLGTSFSFELIRQLLSGEFDYTEDDVDDYDQAQLTKRQGEVVRGLQAAIQAHIIVASESDDKFRFVHDRYIAASQLLGQQLKIKMHFIIAQTLLKYYPTDEQSRDAFAFHVCSAAEVIKQRVAHRQSFRKFLQECAQSAAESGARRTAVKLYATCISLLQRDPWDEKAEDVDYDETLLLFTRTAECHHYTDESDEALALINTVFLKAKSPTDAAPCGVLQSRLYAQRGEPLAAFRTLRKLLTSFDIVVDDQPTFDKCDAEFERLSVKIRGLDLNAMTQSAGAFDPKLTVIGAVFVDTVSAAFWSDVLSFYQMTLLMIDSILRLGTFPQSAMAFMQFSMIAISRFNMISFGTDMGNFAMKLINARRDPFTLGRAIAIHSFFVGHVQYQSSALASQLEGTLEYTIQVGDRISTILNFGLVAALKFFGSDHIANVEAFCQYGPEEIRNWQYDTRGGTILIVIRQVCRALQGKTRTSSSLEMLDDDHHNSARYKYWVRTATPNNDRPIAFYEGFEIAPLFLYGHYDRAIEIGDACMKTIDILWSARSTRFTMLFYALSIAGRTWSRIQDPRLSSSDIKNESGELVEETTVLLKQIRKKIVDWQLVSEVNYYAYSKALDAQIAELQNDHGTALKMYEDALDHASANSFVFEEALCAYLQAGFFLRQGSRRPAKAALKEAVTLYRQFGASGIAKHIEVEHFLLIKGPSASTRTAEVGVQTDFAGDFAAVQYQTHDGDQNIERQQTRAFITESKGDRIDAWQGNAARADAGSGLPALDMIDLTSILECSQVISAVLQVDELLTKMCEIILQVSGGLASLAAIVVEDDHSRGWSVAASGDPENGVRAHIPSLPLKETPFIAESVISYCTSFKESVFLPDLVQDERFSNVSEAWASRNPLGKSIIAIPISHGDKPLLGVLYLEGEPGAFTDRNITVLQWLVNQIGISYSNALTLKAIEKVSASNISMVQSQKRALAKAKEAESKAKRAEAEAIRNVKLAEEAAKAKSIFLANVSHELRTPLNGVIGNSELLRDSDLKREQAEMADSIRVSADLLLTVINDILDFSKMEADKMKLFIVAFNADEMVREVVRSVSYSNRDKRLKAVQIIEDINLPPTLIYGDPVRLHQVLGNLIGNSLKFTEKGSITIGARTDWQTKEAVKLTFWIRDTGIGVPQKQLVKLFTPFSQADASTARKYGGSGLGLSICKSLIESMKGRIELDSQENVGTTAWFTVTFPTSDPNATSDSAKDSAKDSQPNSEISGNPVSSVDAQQADFSKIPRDQLRICIAEDNPVNQKIAIQFVQKLGFKNAVAYDNGMAAVEGLRKKAEEGKPYHLILMDVQMPVLDGYEATRLLRKDPIEAVRTILVIAMTASAIQGDRERCLEAGMNDYLAKPVRVQVLKNKLEQYLQQPSAPIADLQGTANKVAKVVMEDMNGAAAASRPPLPSGTMPLN